MSKIIVLIIAAVVAAVVGYCGVTYYMGDYTPQTEIKKEVQPAKPVVKEADKAKLKG